uniref:ABC-type glutathione-S-conjugate transporter n=1 Tax=Clytia hemisphaerica TaxID=252671 RepID=A0A7M6DQB9_9CNID
MNKLPMKDANFLSRITFWWVTKFIIKGSKQTITNEDIWALEDENSAETISKEFQAEWSREAERKKLQKSKGDGNEKPFLTTIFVRMYWRKYLFCCLFKLIADFFILSTPYILGKLIKSVEHGTSKKEGITYAFILFILLVGQNLVHQQYFYRCYIIAMNFKTLIVSSVYRKMFRLSNQSRTKYPSGKLINFMSTDADRSYQVVTYLVVSWSAPLLIIVSLLSLFRLIGWSTLAGLVVILLSNPINYLSTQLVRKYNQQLVKFKDQRLKLMSEIISGIKIIKMYAWEGSFMQKVTEIRKQELRFVRKSMILSASWDFSITCLPFFVSLATFAVYVYIEKGVLTAEKAFVSITLFNIMRYPFSVVPIFISAVVNYNISAKRISEFLNCEEFDSNGYIRLPGPCDASLNIEIHNGSFGWTPEDKALKDISLGVARGQLIAVVGQVGSGKSSLLSSILGELEKVCGSVKTYGKIAYVSQQAWIQNKNLRQNVLFGKYYRNEAYKKILRACALETDIELLPASDLTEIGEKGINLSGGQKQRVSLARAVYENADIYLFDDPLSAVDAHVGKHIFENIIGSNGLLKDKTRVLVTHGLSFLPHVDHICVIKDKTISQHGSFEKLLESNGGFADILNQFAKASNDNDLEQSIEKEKSTLVDDDHDDEIYEEAPNHPVFQGQISLHSQGGILTTSGKNLYRVIDRMTDEQLFTDDVVEDEEDENETENEKWKLIEQEKVETGNVKLTILMKYLKTIGILASLVIVTCGILQEASLVGSRFWLAHWSSLSPITAKLHRNELISVYGLLGLAQGFFVLFLAIVLALASYRSSKKLHFQLLDTILHCPISFFESTPSGRIMNRFTKDIGGLDSSIPTNLRTCLVDGMGLLGVVYVISFATPLVMVAFIPIFVIYILTQRIYVKSSRQLKRIISINQSPIFNHFMESINGASTIRAFGKVDEFIDENHRRIDHLQRPFLANIMCDRWMLIQIKMLGIFVALFTAIFCVMEKGNISPGILGLTVSYAIQMTQSLISLVRSSNGLEVNLVSIERINDYISKPREASITLQPSREVTPDWPQNGEISLVNYSVRYRPSMPLVLNSINITIRPQEKVGIVGRTGAGKSSITLALFRIIEASTGYISIDGVKISNVALQELRSKISIIPQDPVLFSGSIRFNVDPFQRHTDEQIWNTLEISRLKKFVSTLSGGLDSEVQEGGDNLSVGQRQLICLARALLRMSKILIMDEATASVDMETDLFIQQTIRKEFTGCTILTIAHRLNTIMDYDRILVMEKGEVAEFDSPKTLLADHTTIFYSMVKNAGLLGSI